MTRDSSAYRVARGAALAFSIAAATGGLVLPPLPLVRRGAWALALTMTVLWFCALYVFFAHYAGPGFLGHIALWLLALVGMCAPRRLAALETRIRRLPGWRRPDRPPIAA